MLHPATAGAQVGNLSIVDLIRALPTPEELSDFEIISAKQGELKQPLVLGKGNPPSEAFTQGLAGTDVQTKCS